MPAILSSARIQQQGEQCVATQPQVLLGVPWMQGSQGTPEWHGSAFIIHSRQHLLHEMHALCL